VSADGWIEAAEVGEELGSGKCYRRIRCNLEAVDASRWLGAERWLGCLVRQFKPRLSLFASSIIEIR
jgi:hypothetical protein